MIRVGIHEAKTSLSKLVDGVCRGEKFLIQNTVGLWLASFRPSTRMCRISRKRFGKWKNGTSVKAHPWAEPGLAQVWLEGHRFQLPQRFTPPGK